MKINRERANEHRDKSRRDPLILFEFPFSIQGTKERSKKFFFPANKGKKKIGLSLMREISVISNRKN